MICNLRYNYFTRLSFTIRSRLKLAIVKLIEEQNYESEKIKKSLKKNGREESDPQESNFLDSFKEYLKKNQKVLKKFYTSKHKPVQGKKVTQS